MNLAIDVDYKSSGAHIAGVAFSSWYDSKPSAIYTSRLTDVADYEPGNFFKRELPCILRLLQEHNLTPDSIIIDGFVYLDGHKKPGLGKYLHESLNGETTVIGVAKRHFVSVPSQCRIYRGHSGKPLYVTAAGIALDTAKEHILSMHGDYRMPDLLKKVDMICRSTEC